MDLKEMGWAVALTNLAQDTSPQWHLVNTVLTLRVYLHSWELLG